MRRCSILLPFILVLHEPGSQPVRASSSMADDEAARAPSPAPAAGLKESIAALYDECSGPWERLLSDHIHHGFYDVGEDASSNADHRQAQLRMIEESLAFAAVPSPDDPKAPKNIVDVGCGLGGSSRYLAKKYGAQVKGITLSPVQAERGNALAAAEGLSNQVTAQVADALQQPFCDGQFDLVWSMECGEHVPDRRKFVSEMARVAAPGGRIIIVAWCHRNLEPSETSLKPDELSILKRICNAYYFPEWCSASEYVNIAKSLSLEDIKTADWSENIVPFWPACMKLLLSWKGLTSLLTSGWKTIKGVMVIPLLIQGYKKGVVKFAIITCRKPGAA